jgi:uncharacterized membrane protein
MAESAVAAPTPTSPGPVAAAPPARRRLESVDTLRGVIMIIMAIDHVRDFFGAPGADPTNLATTTVPLFFTRWITHFCAPVFFLLTGTGAYLALRRKSVTELSRYLVTRGLWLLVLELTVLRCLGFQFNFDYRVTLVNVLWALGWSMIALSALVWLRPPVVTAIGLVMIAGHNLLDGARSTHPLWVVLHQPGFLIATPPHVLFVAYPLIPWIGVTAAGFGLGQIYGWAPGRRRAFLTRAGLAACGAFIALRWLNIYGDPSRWRQQPSAMLTLLSFLNTTKYPPSLLFLLMTLGPAILLLAALDDRTPGALRPALVFGKVPMFYFLIHLPLIHLLVVAFGLIGWGSAGWAFRSPDLAHYPFTAPPGWGFPLPVIYLLWAGVVLALYPACRWYAGVRARRTDWWLSYL